MLAPKPTDANPFAALAETYGFLPDEAYHNDAGTSYHIGLTSPNGRIRIRANTFHLDSTPTHRFAVRNRGYLVAHGHDLSHLQHVLDSLIGELA